MDYYKCEWCGKVFDEFEMDYANAQKDKKCLCYECRKEFQEIKETREWIESKRPEPSIQ